MEHLSLSRLLLTNYRNYASYSLDIDTKPVIITGPNGAGKTNILESISFLSPGRGLRNSKLGIVGQITDSGHQAWAVSAKIRDRHGETKIGTGIEQAGASKRSVRVNSEAVKGHALLADIFSVMWLTPQMDRLFLEGTSERRKFMDRLVFNFDSEHAKRVNKYEYVMRQRAKILQERGSRQWVAILEQQMAEQAVAVAAARNESIAIIQKSISETTSAFPKAEIKVVGAIEEALESKKAIEVEEEFKQKLLESRDHDMYSGRTNHGTHRSDFQAFHIEKNMPAASCSTGEQKALLLSIILAEARAKARWKQSVPVLLLDEVVAHLDSNRRAALFEEILAMGAQTWMTGTDISLFDAIIGDAQCVGM